METMTEKTKTPSHAQQSCTVIATLPNSELAEETRRLVMHEVRRSWVFVTKIADDEYEVSVSNEFGGYLSDDVLFEVMTKIDERVMCKVPRPETFTEEDGVLYLDEDDFVEIGED